MPWISLMLAAAASAQEVAPAAVPEPAGPLADDSSIGPVLEALTSVLSNFEAKGLQVTDIALGRVKDDGVGVKLKLAPLNAGSSVVVAGVGDSRRIADLDLAVTDKNGGRWTDQLADNVPVVQFESSDGGEFEANVIITEPLPGATDGFFLLISGLMTDPENVVTASRMVETLQSANTYAEGLSLRFVTGAMVVMLAGQNSSIDLEIPASAGSQCLIMSFGDPARTKKLAMSVMDKNGNVVGANKGTREVVGTLVPVGGTSATYRVVLTPKLTTGDSHAMALAACQ